MKSNRNPSYPKINRIKVQTKSHRQKKLHILPDRQIEEKS